MKTHIDKLILEPFQRLGETLRGTFDCNPVFCKDSPVDYPLSDKDFFGSLTQHK